MENFEEIISKIAIKTETKHGVTYYESKIRHKTKQIDIRTYDKPVSPPGKSFIAKEVITPLGTFKTAIDAAEAHGITKTGLYRRIKLNGENYYYGKQNSYLSNYTPKV